MVYQVFSALLPSGFPSPLWGKGWEESPWKKTPTSAAVTFGAVHSATLPQCLHQSSGRRSPFSRKCKGSTPTPARTRCTPSVIEDGEGSTAHVVPGGSGSILNPSTVKGQGEFWDQNNVALRSGWVHLGLFCQRVLVILERGTTG